MPFTIVATMLVLWVLYRAREAIWPRQSPPSEHPPADPVRDALTVTEFQQRRRVFLIAMAIMVSMFGYLYVVQILRRQQMDVILGLPFTVHIYAAFAVMGVSLLVGSVKYRCPRCGNMPWATAGSGRRMVELNPTACSSCGARLR